MMKLKIRNVVDCGTLTSECVIIDVLQDANLKRYMLMDTTYTSDGKSISNTWRHSKWFLSKELKKGDVIRVYTTEGNYRELKLPSGGTEYTYYWGLKNCIWNNEGDGALLFEINAWATTPVNTRK